MLISIEKRFVFIANTKTASTSIEKSLSRYAEFSSDSNPKSKHMPIVEVRKKFSELTAYEKSIPDINHYFVFGVMREPLDWIASWFKYRHRQDIESPLAKNMSFIDFWHKRDWNIVRHTGEPYLQRDRFCDANGKNLMDLIIPYHKLGSVYPKVCDALGVNSDLGFHNVSPSKSSTIPEELIENITDHYKKDYELWHNLDKLNNLGLKKLHDRKRDISS